MAVEPASGAFLVLEGAAVEAWVDVVVALLEHACPHRFFPDVGQVRNLLMALKPSRHGGLYPALRLDSTTGLPAEPEVSRVMADCILAQAEAAPRCERAACGRPEAREDLAESEPSSRLSLRRSYYRFLQQEPPPAAVSLVLDLRRVDEARRATWVEVTSDRFDLARSVFVRHTIMLRLQRSRWSRAQVEMRGNRLVCTDNFRHVVARFASDEAEIAFLLLSELPGVTVEEVRRCRIGPLYGRGVRMPEAFAGLCERHPEDFILHLPSDRAALDLVRDTCCDPLSMPYREFLRGEARAVVQELARALGYHAHKERRFCCTSGVASGLKELLSSLGVPPLIHVLPARPAQGGP